MEEEADEFEEWDADFLDQLIQVEERALSTQLPPPLPQPPPSHSFTQAHRFPISYSPPRELSQRNSRVSTSNTVVDTAVPKTSSTRCYSGDSSKDRDNQILKRDQRHVPNQLGARSQEGAPIEHKNEKGKKNEQIKSALNHAECKGFAGQSSKEFSLSYTKDMVFGSRNTGILAAKDFEVSGVAEMMKSSKNEDKIHSKMVSPTCKAVGVQTDSVEESSLLLFNHDQHACHKLSGKLLSIWNPSYEQKAVRSFISNLLVDCHSLFMLKDGVGSSKTKLDSVEDESSANAYWSKFYHVLTEISNGMAQIEALFKPLINLYSLENVSIVHRSLCITKLILKNLLSSQSKTGKRYYFMETLQLLCCRMSNMEFLFRELVLVLKGGTSQFLSSFFKILKR